MTNKKTSPAAPLVIPVKRPRNPFGVGAQMLTAGSHAKSEKTKRRQVKESLKKDPMNWDEPTL